MKWCPSDCVPFRPSVVIPRMPTPLHSVGRPGRAHAWRPVARLLAGVWFTLYLAVVAGLPLVDAGIEHREVVAHWEDASDERCPPQHAGETCVLFQTITTGASPSVVGTLVATELRLVDSVRPVEADRVQRLVHAARPRTRGPPAA